MMRLSVFLFTILLGSFSSRLPLKGEPVKVYFNEKSDGVCTFYADNENYCPYHVVVRFDELVNYTVNVPLPFTATIQRGERHFLFDITPAQNAASRFRYSYDFYLGDPNAAAHNDRNEYILPFREGFTSLVGQGYNGKFSHQGDNALDFIMPVGTIVCAAREGVVVDFKQDFDEGGLTDYYKLRANYITIYHNDGTFANYVHLKKNGCFVHVGTVIRRGEMIGLSGNTGYSARPHLHFQVFKPIFSDRQSIPTRFLVGPSQAVELQEGSSYTSFRP